MEACGQCTLHDGLHGKLLALAKIGVAALVRWRHRDGVASLPPSTARNDELSGAHGGIRLELRPRRHRPAIHAHNARRDQLAVCGAIGARWARVVVKVDRHVVCRLAVGADMQLASALNSDGVHAHERVATDAQRASDVEVVARQAVACDRVIQTRNQLAARKKRQRRR
jgi:hypothetical protein